MHLSLFWVLVPVADWSYLTRFKNPPLKSGRVARPTRETAAGCKKKKKIRTEHNYGLYNGLD